MFTGILQDNLEMVFGNSIVSYDKEPVFIFDTNIGDFNVVAKRLKDMEVISFTIFDPKVEIRGLNTGNVNIEGHVVHFYRTPERQYKQGLHRNNVKITTTARTSMEEIGISQWVKRLDFRIYDTLKNTYPSLKDCLESVSNGNSVESAFDRQFSVDNKFKLYYKRNFVGAVNSDNGEFYFIPKFAHLARIV